MKVVNKILSGLLLFFICGILFCIGSMTLLGEGYNPFYPAVDTQFSSGFRQELFQEIKAGDDTVTVKMRIGRPLEVYAIPDSDRMQWNYSTDGKCKWGDFAWLLKAVVVDKDGKVVEIMDKVIYD